MPRPKKAKKQSVPPTNKFEEQVELWHRHFNSFNSQEQETILSETRAAQAAGGSRLAIAMHLLVVRNMLNGEATNPKQKKLWSAYLAVFLPGLCISRSQLFIDLAGAEAAQKAFPPKFLQAFISGGYALRMRPTEQEPLGKFTAYCQHLLTKLGHQPDEAESKFLLAEAAANIKADAKKSRVKKAALTADEKRKSILEALHNMTLRSFEDLAEAIEIGESYTPMRVRDDLEEFVCRLMTAMEIDDLELRQMPLPEGFNRLNLPDSAVNSSKTDDTSEAALAATAA